MDWAFALGLGAITLFLIGLVIYFGVKLNKAILKHAPEATLSVNITFTGTVVTACVVGFWVVCLVARELTPESSLGTFVGTVDGLATVFVGPVFFAGIAGAILDKLGHPLAMRDEHP
jgi:hypothetical protein